MTTVIKKKKAKNSLIPNGTYKAELTKIAPFSNAYGDRIGFEFILLSSSSKGLKIMRSTSPNLSEQSKLAVILRCLLGRELTEEEIEEGFNLDKLVNTKCNIVVIQGRCKSGSIYSNVESIYLD